MHAIADIRYTDRCRRSSICSGWITTGFAYFRARTTTIVAGTTARKFAAGESEQARNNPISAPQRIDFKIDARQINPIATASSTGQKYFDGQQHLPIGHERLICQHRRPQCAAREGHRDQQLAEAELPWFRRRLTGRDFAGIAHWSRRLAARNGRLTCLPLERQYTTRGADCRLSSGRSQITTSRTGSHAHAEPWA